MEPSFRPSKQFIIRGGVALGLLAIILVVQTTWFKSLFNKKTAEESASTVTVGDIVDKDSNQNGIMDWEEQLWGLDPTKALTNGVSNKELISQKKKALGIEDNSNELLNETDVLARDLFTLTSALSQSGEVNDQALQGVAAKFGSVIDVKSLQNNYSLKNLPTVKTTETSLNQYYNTMGKILTKYDENSTSIDALISALESGDLSQLSSLKDTAVTYKNLAKEMSVIAVPIGVAEYHLAIINSIYGMSQSFSYIIQLEDNGVNGLAGIALYKGYSNRLGTALVDLSDYFARYGILVE
jgi:hypothetical protein